MTSDTNRRDSPVKFRSISVAFKLKMADARCLPAALLGGEGGFADVATRAEASARPAATQTNVCGDKVSQLPSGAWSYSDTRPAARPPPRPRPPQMGSESGQISPGLKYIFH